MQELNLGFYPKVRFATALEKKRIRTLGPAGVCAPTSGRWKRIAPGRAATDGERGEAVKPQYYPPSRNMRAARAEYLVGDSFTAADVYVGSHIGFGMQFGTIEKRPAFEQYWRRINARPAALRAKEIDDALVAQEQPQSSG